MNDDADETTSPFVVTPSRIQMTIVSPVLEKKYTVDWYPYPGGNPDAEAFQLAMSMEQLYQMVHRDLREARGRNGD